MAKPHAPASLGSVPPEAESKGSLNESTPVDQRAIDGAPLGEGPIRDEKDSFLPATYQTTRGNVRTDR